MEIKSSKLIKIKLSKTNSHIIQQNKGIFFCSVYLGLKGIFKKDIKEHNKFGRKICDIVKEKINNHGFFTSDELPSYGISKKELKEIYNQTKAEENDLIIIFAYNKKESQKTKEFLDKLLKEQPQKHFLTLFS